MRNFIQISVFYVLLFCSIENSFGQEKNNFGVDAPIKEALYTKYKKEVNGYTKLQFDELFFEFFRKQSDAKTLLTKEEYYTYTIKIACYSERLGLLYKSQKAESQIAKQEWIDKSYQDYLKTKKSNP
jgi:hypothetical protein